MFGPGAYLKTAICMSNFSVAGRACELTGFSGQVIANRRWSETHVESGGEGHFNPITFAITMPSIRSFAVDRQEFWIRLDSGQEVPCQFAGSTVPVTVGQSVRLIALRVSGQSVLQAALINRATNRWHLLCNIGDLVHQYLYRRASWAVAAAICLLGWITEVAVFAFLTLGPGAGAAKPALQSRAFQDAVGHVLDLLPSPPGAHDRGETLVFLFMLGGLALIAAPPIVALIRYVRRARRFQRYADQLAAQIGEFARTTN